MKKYLLLAIFGLVHHLGFADVIPKDCPAIAAIKVHSFQTSILLGSDNYAVSMTNNFNSNIVWRFIIEPVHAKSMSDAKVVGNDILANQVGELKSGPEFDKEFRNWVCDYSIDGELIARAFAYPGGLEAI